MVGTGVVGKAILLPLLGIVGNTVSKFTSLPLPGSLGRILCTLSIHATPHSFAFFHSFP